MQRLTSPTFEQREIRRCRLKLTARIIDNQDVIQVLIALGSAVLLISLATMLPVRGL